VIRVRRACPATDDEKRIVIQTVAEMLYELSR
jgi:hypothetical protein